MMRRATTFLGIILLTLLLLTGTGGCSRGDTGTSPSTSQPMTLTYAFFAPEESFPGAQMDWWATEIEKRTNGKVVVRTIPGGELFTAENMYDGVRSGVADIGLSFVTYEASNFPLLTINDLPGIGYANATQASKAFFEVVWANQDIEELKDFKIITAFCTEPSYIQTMTKHTSLESLKGVPIRTPGGPKILEAMGAVGVNMPQSKIEQALDNFLIEGIVTSREVLKDFGYAKKIKFVLNKPLGQVSALAVMRKATFDTLPDDIKTVIDELAPLAAAYAGAALDKAVNESMEWATESQGVTVVELSADESRKMDEAIQTVAENWLADLTAKGYAANEFFRQLQQAASQAASK
ncbi:MAG: TRAP transporter substrate-binding protein DctP [Actinobacteria bacterium]|nr:TRAP transporter substrate-binding protein DctP [Actinomycetota bacterium]